MGIFIIYAIYDIYFLMPKLNKRIYKSSRKKILLGAKRIFARHGFDRSTVDMIAAKANVVKGTVYHHFSSKEDIFKSVMDLLGLEFKQIYESSIQDTFSAEAKLERALNLLVNGNMDNQRLGLLAIFEFSISQNNLIGKMEDNHFHRTLKEILDEGQRKKEFHTDFKTMEFAGLILSVIVSQVMLLEINSKKYDLTSYKKNIVRFIINGLK